VLLAPPTISSYSWNSTPTGNIAFSGTINGTNFVASGTQVFSASTEAGLATASDRWRDR